MKDLFTTLDGEVWDRNELVEKAIEDKFIMVIYQRHVCLVVQ